MFLWPSRQTERSSLAHRLRMGALFPREMSTQAASRVLAVMLGVRIRLFFRGSLPQPDSAQAFGTAKGFILQTQRFFDMHRLPAKDPAVRKTFSKVNIWVDTERAVSIKQVFTLSATSTWVCKYSNFQINQSVPKDAFSFKTDRKTVYQNQ